MNNFIELINLLTQQEYGKISVTIEKKMMYNKQVYEIRVKFVDVDNRTLEKQFQFNEEMFCCKVYPVPKAICEAVDTSAGDIVEYKLINN